MEGVILSCYVALAVGLAAVGYMQRQRLLRGPDGLNADTLDGEEVGYLLGEHERAVAAALAGLRAAGSIRIEQHGCLTRGEGPPPKGRIAGEILRTVTLPVTSAGIAVRTAYDHGWVQAAVVDVRDRLVDRGWLIDRRARRRIAACGLPLIVLATVGFVAAAVSTASGEPAGDALAGAVGASIGGLYLAFLIPDRYERVEAELGRLRAAQDHLRPEHAPALVTYGPAAAALAVGLFGTSALLHLDPNLAATAAGPAAPDGKSKNGAGSGCGGCGGGGCGGCGGGCGCGG
jgi:uncharacterized protein (TIGR04222 family)